MAHSFEKPNDTAPSIETTPEYHRAVTLLVGQVLAMGEYNRGERHDQPALSILLERGRTTALETTVLAGRTTEHPENIKQELEALVMTGVASASEESDEVVYAANRSVSISRPPRLDDRKLSVAEFIDQLLAIDDILIDKLGRLPR